MREEVECRSLLGVRKREEVRVKKRKEVGADHKQ